VSRRPGFCGWLWRRLGRSSRCACAFPLSATVGVSTIFSNTASVVCRARRFRTVIEQQVRLADGRRPRPALGVRAGEDHHRQPFPRRVEPEVPRHFDILAEDESFLALDKPAGLPMAHHGASSGRTLWSRSCVSAFPARPCKSATGWIGKLRAVLLVARGGWQPRS